LELIALHFIFFQISQVAVKADLALRPPSAHLLLTLPRDLTFEGFLRQAKLHHFQPDFEAYGIETVRLLY
jgi:hypothetical protein